MGVLVVVGIVSVLMASLDYGGYPVPETLVFAEGSVLRTIGINAGIFVLLLGLVLSMYGNVLRARYVRQRRDRRASGTAADGGEPSGTGPSSSEPRSDGGEPVGDGCERRGTGDE